MTLRLAQEPDADALLDRSPLALLLGMLLDQQVPMERAFAGPHVLTERLGRDLDAADIASRDPDEFAALMAVPPAVHRYPGAMAGRIQALSRSIVEHYDGDAEQIWAGASSGAELVTRLKALPGFGDQKARIFLALLGKQRGIQPAGWREAAGAYGDEGSFRSVADVHDAESLARVRAFKQEVKRAAKST